MNNSLNHAGRDSVRGELPDSAPERSEKIGTEKTRIMMVDDHPIVREGMAQFLNAQPDLHLCCEAGSSQEAHALMPSCDPALVIVDISLKHESGLDLIKSLRRNHPQVALLAMSQHDELIFAEHALRAGASGYLMKQEATSHILLAIRRVLAGDVYLSDAMHSRLSRRLMHPGSVAPSPLAGLSERLSLVEAAMFWFDADLSNLHVRPTLSDLEQIDFGGVLREAAESLKAEAENPAANPVERRRAEEALVQLFLMTRNDIKGNAA